MAKPVALMQIGYLGVIETPHFHLIAVRKGSARQSNCPFQIRLTTYSTLTNGQGFLLYHVDLLYFRLSHCICAASQLYFRWLQMVATHNFSLYSYWLLNLLYTIHFQEPIKVNFFVENSPSHPIKRDR